jgi:hypothetical protein
MGAISLDLFNVSALEPAVYRTQSENTDHYITITISIELEDRQQNIKSSESHSWFKQWYRDRIIKSK